VGIFLANLGDTNVPDMTLAISPNVFTNTLVYLRTWVNDGVDDWPQLSPDRQRCDRPGARAGGAIVPPIGHFSGFKAGAGIFAFD
jgi:hypothetical protein